MEDSVVCFAEFGRAFVGQVRPAAAYDYVAYVERTGGSGDHVFVPVGVGECVGVRKGFGESRAGAL